MTLDRDDLAAWLELGVHDLDLFAGPGGWDEGIRHLGLRPLGVEWDARACETARAAGHLRFQGDIAKLNPEHFGRRARVRLLIGSPPCQGFSAAGKGLGRRDADRLLAAIPQLASDPAGVIAGLHEHMHDDRSVLALEPLRWALALRPQFVALEQVPGVLPMWEAMAVVLRDHGYSVQTGIISTEEYGVPQTRERAILVARDAAQTAALGPAELAPQTHSTYDRRRPERLQEGLPKWVSMAEALGWGMVARPYFTVAGGTAAGGADHAMLGGSGARAALDREITEERWLQQSNYSGPGKPGETAAERGLGTRELTEPSFAVTSKAFRWAPESMVQSARGNATVRTVDEPAPTITGGHDSAERRWQMSSAGATARHTSGQVPRDLDLPSATITGAGTAYRTAEGLTRDEAPGAARVPQPVPDDAVYRNGNRGNAAERELDQPAPTLHFGERANKVDWAFDRPATTVQGDPRIAAPGHKDRSNGGESQFASAKTVRVSVAEAAVLQTFPADYPWQGNKGDQYRQVGDAVPPLAAFHLVKHLLHLD